MTGAAYADLTALIADLQEASHGDDITEQALDEVSDEIFMDQTAHVPVKTGLLKSTIHIERSAGMRFIGPRHEMAPYDIFVAEGTKAHVIEAKPGKVLVFKVNGKTVFAKKVHHPGTQPQPFAEQSLTRWQESLGDKLQDAVVRKITDGS